MTRRTIALNEAKFIILASSIQAMEEAFDEDHPMRMRLAQIRELVSTARMENRLSKAVPQVAEEFEERYYHK